MLQVATIIGGMFARTYGDMAPWLIPIGLKTLFDDQRRTASPPRIGDCAGPKGCGVTFDRRRFSGQGSIA
jgi:hypothetical protein